MSHSDLTFFTNDPNHPVRNHLETLDSVEEVRIIRDALKK